MKQIAGAINQMSQDDIARFEKESAYELVVGDENVHLGLEDVEILSEDIPGWLVANEGGLTVALDIEVSPELRQEGIAREFINRIQNLRKESDFEVTDKINLRIARQDEINEAVNNFSDYISNQTLASNLELVDAIEDEKARLVEIDKGVETYIMVEKVGK